MANEEQLAILKQGVEVWNRWRDDNPDAKIDLSKADLTDANLNGVNLRNALIYFANLRHTHLREAEMHEADLAYAKIIEADLSDATLSQANLGNTIFSGTNLKRANLRQAYLSEAYLNETDLSGAILAGSYFASTTMDGAIFRKLDLSEVIGLELVVHLGPSSISTDVFVFSKAKIPDAFLRGCGLSNWEVEMVKLYDPDLTNNQFIDIQNKIFNLRQQQAIQISPLFISYSHTDSIFVNNLESKLNEKGIRFWRDIHDMKSGRMEKQIDRAIRQNPTVLLVLSEHSLNSDWVEHEVRAARGLEKDLGRDVLCPITLDDSWKDSRWDKHLMEQVKKYNILDFSEWKDDSKFDGMFRKLIDGLELFYKG